VDISFYIADLLDEHEYVIVPGLGAFIFSYRPAKFNEESSILLPPSRVLSFNPELKINDGLLTRYIAQQQKITLTQASRLLEKFTGDVMYQLELGEEIFLRNIGTLIVQQGKLMFNPAESSQINSESFGLQPVTFSDNPSMLENKEVITADNKRKNLFSRWIWIGSFLLFFLISFSLYFVFFTNHQLVTPPDPDIQNDSLDNKKPETGLTPDSTFFEQNEIKPALNDTLAQHPRKELYYTIGGSFRSPQNANEYFEKMSRKGFHPIQLGLIGNFYLVALDTFFTADDAFKAAVLYSPINRNTEIWVYHAK
jgi:nucleoid DNA-binding protein